MRLGTLSTGVIAAAVEARASCPSCRGKEYPRPRHTKSLTIVYIRHGVGQFLISLIDLEYDLVTLDPRMMGLDACWKHIGGDGGETPACSFISESLFRQRGDSRHGPAWSFISNFLAPSVNYACNRGSTPIECGDSVDFSK